ncbi:MAG TPA: DUF1343 domain-containing protein [Anaerolineae bacterium]|nr:DUF1343 domain-containing protein [Anaerolineae bacterium]
MGVKLGLEYFLRELAPGLRGRRVGLATHPGAVTPDLTHCLDALLSAGVRVTALFAPEHGLAGSVADGATVAHGVHARTGLPIFSLYGATKEPTPAMLADVDVLVFDMQDIGARFYTFISTLFYVLRGAARARTPVIVLDRPNPINGVDVEGPLVTPGFESFVGIVPIPIRHGLTLGELARYINGEQALEADLTIAPLAGWRRGLWLDETGLPWIPTSPAMPRLSTATVYPGMCLLEGTNVSEGRGTALPFEVCGAPWIDGETLAAELNARALPGVRFRPTQFVPSASKYAGEVCAGVQGHVLDRRLLRPVALGVWLLATLRRLYPESFNWITPSWEGSLPHIDLLTGCDRLRNCLDAGENVPDLLTAWRADSLQAMPTLRRYDIYPT